MRIASRACRPATHVYHASVEDGDAHAFASPALKVRRSVEKRLQDIRLSRNSYDTPGGSLSHFSQKLLQTQQIAANARKRELQTHPEKYGLIFGSGAGLPNIIVTSRKVVWLFLEQLWLKFVPFLHRLQGRLAAQG